MTLPNDILNWLPPTVEIFKWFWNTYGDDLLKSTAKTAWHKFDHIKSAKLYTKKVEELYGTMRILGRSEPISVTDIYTSLSILDRFTAQLRYDSERLSQELWNRKSSQETINRIDGMEVVKNTN